MAETINGYYLEQPLKTDNSGFSKWGFGTRAGKEYFMKEFLSPVYPMDESLLGPELTQKRKEICRQYVLSKQLLFRTINEATDGNLVRIEHFFRYGSRFYIVMEKVEPVPIVEVLGLNQEEKLRLCLILTHAIAGMHQAGLVHGDIKLDNVIFCRTQDGIGAKIIDLDTCFWEKNPPSGETEIVGDQIYMAPETFRLIAQEEGTLNGKIDVFALGLMFHQIFAGALPGFGECDFHYAYEVLINGKSLEISTSIPSELAAVISPMLERDPENRTTLAKVYEQLQKQYRELTGLPEAGAYAYKNHAFEKDVHETKAYHNRTEVKQDDFFFRAGEDDL